MCLRSSGLLLVGKFKNIEQEAAESAENIDDKRSNVNILRVVSFIYVKAGFD